LGLRRAAPAGVNPGIRRVAASRINMRPVATRNPSR
jgi:hypothetical protein